MQIRSLKSLAEAEKDREENSKETKEDMERLISSLPDKLQNAEKPKQQLTFVQPWTVAEIVPEDSPEEGASQLGGAEVEGASIGGEYSLTDSRLSEEVRERFDELVELQASRDQTKDHANLRKLMLEALRKSSDGELLEFLQLKKDELPEAMNELQAALQDLRRRKEEHEPANSAADAVGDELSFRSADFLNEDPTTMPARAETMPAKLHDFDLNDELDLVFIESAIKALNRQKSV